MLSGWTPALIMSECSKEEEEEHSEKLPSSICRDVIKKGCILFSWIPMGKIRTNKRKWLEIGLGNRWVPNPYKTLECRVLFVFHLQLTSPALIHLKNGPSPFPLPPTLPCTQHREMSFCYCHKDWRDICWCACLAQQRLCHSWRL